MKPRYDVVVVGAGPSGLLATKALAENGFDVAVVDRKEDLGATHRTCGQTLLPPDEYFFGSLFHVNEKDQRFCFTEAGLTFPYTGAWKPVFSWHMYSPGMKHIQFGSDDAPAPGVPRAPISLSYEKDVLLGCLVEEVQSDHVDIFSGTEFTDIRWEGPEVVVTAGDMALRSTFVIAADGTNSKVVEKLGFNNNRRHIADLYVKSYFIKGFRSPCGGASNITAITYIDGSPVYLFIVPRPDGNAWNFLMLTFNDNVDLSKAYDQIAADARYAEWFKGAERVQEFGAFERVCSPVYKPFRNNVCIVGDAGSCQELECLGAMVTGWRGGLAVAGALKEMQLGIAPRAIPQYVDWWLNTYIKQYDYQDYLSVFGIAYVFGSAEVIDYIFGLLGEPFPPTFNPYKSVGLLGQRLQSVIPRIMAERPDVLQQLAGNMMAFPSDILGQTR